jgi:hypothetical protein
MCAVVVMPAAALSLAPAHATPQAAQLTALVTVVAESGVPATGLTATDFTVREGSATYEISRVTPVNDLPLHVAILIDMSKAKMGSQPPVNDLRSSVKAFVAAVRAANPAAQFSLMEIAGAAVPSVGFDAPPETLDSAIAKLYPSQQGDAVMLEGMADAARALGERPGLRRAIVMIEFGSNEPSREATMRESVDAVQRAQATVWAVSIRSSGSASRREMALKAAIDVSGGMRLTGVSASGLTTLMKQAADSLSSQYLVTFSRPGTAAIRYDAMKFEASGGRKALLVSLMR